MSLNDQNSMLRHFFQKIMMIIKKLYITAPLLFLVGPIAIALWLTSSPQPSPTETAALVQMYLIKLLFIAYIFIRIFFDILRLSASSYFFPDLSWWMVMVARFQDCCVYTCIIYFHRIYSEEISNFVQSAILEASNSIPLLLSIMSFIFILQFPTLFRSTISHISQIAQTLYIYILGIRRSKEEIYRIAAHEAGHAILVALLDQEYNSISISIKPRNRLNDIFAGYVKYRDKTYKNHGQEGLFQSMRICLAGMEAEHCANLGRGTGSGVDYADWVFLANHYLSRGFGGVYYSRPENDVQIKQNELSINALRAEVTTSIRAVLTANWKIHQELVDLLIEYKSLGWPVLQPILSRVVHPKAIDVTLLDGGLGI